MSKDSERATYWREHVARWRHSGQTQAAYSAAHGVSKKSLSYWVSQVRLRAAAETEAALTLVAARPVVTPSGLPGSAVLTVHSAAGWRVEFGALPPALWLAELIASGAAR